jgi:hypothetical protein
MSAQLSDAHDLVGNAEFFELTDIDDGFLPYHHDT